MPAWLTTQEATIRLGVSRATLYAYASRGLVRARPAEDDPRRSLYRAEDIAALATRKRRGRTPARAAGSALDWGLPVLESAITLIESGALRYRGRDAVALAQGGATLEDAARLLWGADAADDPFAAPQPSPPPAWPALAPSLADLAPIDRCLVLLPLLAGADAALWPANAPQLRIAAARLLRTVAAALLGGLPGGEPIHRQLAVAWRLDRRGAELLRLALVLSADHELNASTFVVRGVASTHAALGACVIAGLTALSGPLHGGFTFRVASFLAEADRIGDAPRAVAERLRRGEALPGFGHPLYPDGDPRAAALLSRLADPEVERLVEAVVQTGGPLPTIDFALVALQRRLGLPDGAAFAVFAAGRTAGWIAHAIEQRLTGSLIRPRARYVGERPGATAA